MLFRHLRVPTLTRKNLRDLWHIRGQATAIIFVVAAGIAMYTTFMGTLAALSDSQAAYYERNRFADLFAAARRAPSRHAADLKALPGIAVVQDEVRSAAILDIPNVKEPASGLILSLPDRGEPVLNKPVLRQGRYPAPDSDREILLLEPMAEKNGLKPGDSFWATVKGHRIELTIAGIVLSPEFVYALPPGRISPDDRLYGIMWMRRAALAAALDMTGAFNYVSLGLTVGADEAALKPAIDRILAPYGGTKAFGRDLQDSNVFLEAEIDGLRSMGRVMPLVFLGVAVFLLNVVVGRVLEQEREQIGLMKAFGYSSLDVAYHYAKLVLFIVLLGLALGTGLGIWLGRGMTELYAEFFRFPYLIYSPPPSVYGTAAVMALIAGAIGVVSSVRKVLKLAPAVAMAPPAPPNYTHGLLDILNPAAWAGTMGGMILRHMVRRPGRAFLTWFGLALALGLNIGSAFMIDAVDEMLLMQFDRLERQDALVTLTEIENRSVLNDFRALPGVLYAEPFRSASATLSFGHQSKRLAVTGVAPNPRLTKVVDVNDQPIAVPEHGVILSEGVARRLGADLGDRIHLAFEAHKRHEADVPVVGIAAGYVGQAAYMSLDALNRVTGDGPVISGARLTLDPALEDTLYIALKDRPGVQGVSLRKTILSSLDETLTQNFLIMTVAATLFAGIIAVGIVYNEARVTLSERGRELASLRVLGFSRAEVSVVLLGELAILIIASLPLGAYMGYGLAWVMSNAAYENELMDIPLIVQPHTYGFGALVVLLSGVVAGALVRRRVDHLDLVEVLKTRE